MPSNACVVRGFLPWKSYQNSLCSCIGKNKKAAIGSGARVDTLTYLLVTYLLSLPYLFIYWLFVLLLWTEEDVLTPRPRMDDSKFLHIVNKISIQLKFRTAAEARAKASPSCHNQIKETKIKQLFCTLRALKSTQDVRAFSYKQFGTQEINTVTTSVPHWRSNCHLESRGIWRRKVICSQSNRFQYQIIWQQYKLCCHPLMNGVNITDWKSLVIYLDNHP